MTLGCAGKSGNFFRAGLTLAAKSAKLLSTQRVSIHRQTLFIIGLGLSLFFGASLPTIAADGSDVISDGALQQITALEHEKSGRSAIHRKLDSHFVYQLKLSRGEFSMPGDANWHPQLKLQGDGRVLVDIAALVTDDLLQKIQAAGGTVVNSVPRFHSVRASVPLASLESLASLTNVTFIKRAVQARVFTGSVDSEGDVTHGADVARTNLGVNGAGVKVGVISDSVDFLTNSQATGDLPANVTVLDGQSGLPGSGEGTAMLEIVNDLAPGAQLYFATAFGSEEGFAQNILNLRSNGCNIIVDDVGYFDESPFQDGIVAQAVNSVTADGALYFSAAGNGGNKDNNASGTWEGDFVDGGAVGSRSAIGRIEPGRLHNFGSSTFDTVTGLGQTTQDVALFWSDPLGASPNDYDLFVLNSNGTQVYDFSDGTQDGTQDPFEICTAANNCRIVVVKYAGAARFFHLQLLSDGLGSLNTSTAGGISGHSTATNAFAVAAVDANAAFPNLFTTNNVVEYFSSDGPRRVFFNTDGTPITPGNFSSTGGALRQKPDIAAANGVSTSVPGFAPFYGTSAAAPHAAAIAALLLSYDPALTPAQIRTVLTGTALDISATGWDRDAGAGIIMAARALQSITPLAASITSSSLTNRSVQCGSNNLAFTVAATGVPPLNYQWSLDGTPILNATNASFSLANLHLPNHLVSVIVTNSYGSATNNATAAVQDTLAPAMTLNGNNPLFLELGNLFTDPGATANDACAGLIPVSTSGIINANLIGTNLLTYEADDGNGNTNIVVRSVIVRDTTPPTLLWSFTNLVLAAGTNCSAQMPDVTGTNYILPTDLSGALAIAQNPTNNSTLPVGTNPVVITVADVSGNAAYSTNIIIVQDQTPPFFLSQPQNQTNLIGTMANFSAVATACTPLVYQWFFNSAVLTNATNYALAIPSIGTNNSGKYFVIANASGGSSTSAVVTLTVNLIPPAINGVAASLDGSFNLNLTGTPGYTYVLETKPDLSPTTVWQPIATNMLGTNGVWQFNDSSATNFPQRFYRLKLAP
jgi:Subtilase family/Domain of unknown function (DUF5011)